MDDDFTPFRDDDVEEWDVEAPTSLVVASTLSALAQLLKVIFMFIIDLGALAATIYFAVTGRWALFVVMLVIGIALVAAVADIVSGIVIAPFVLAEAWIGRRAQRAFNESGRFSLPTAPAPSRPTDAAPPRRRRWRQIGLVVGLIIFVAIGAVTAAGRPATGVYYHSSSEWASALTEGAIISLVYLMAIGTIGYAIGRWRRRGDRELAPRGWRRTVFGRSAMIVTLVLLVASAGGRAVSHQEAVQKATANPTGTAVQREKANLDAQQWASSRKPIYEGYAALVKRNAAFVEAFGAQGNTPSIRAMAQQIERKLAGLHARLDLLRTPPLAGLRALDEKLGEILALWASGYSDYAAGLKANLASGIPVRTDKGALALIDSGDAKLNRAGRIIRAFVKQTAALDKKYSIH